MPKPMQLPLNKEEQAVFSSLAGSHTGNVLAGYVEKLIKQVESVRTKLDLTDKERVAVADVIDQNILQRLQKRNSRMAGPEKDEYDVYEEDEMVT